MAISKALGIAVKSSAALFTIMLCFVIGKESPKVSASWNASVPIMERLTCPVIAIIGIESQRASAMAVKRFIAPGPLVAMQTAGFPVVRAKPCAMKPAACSWRTKTCLIPLRANSS